MKKILRLLLNPLILTAPLVAVVSCEFSQKSKNDQLSDNNYGYDKMDDEKNVVNDKKDEKVEDSKVKSVKLTNNSIKSEEYRNNYYTSAKKSLWHLENSKEVYGVDIFYESIGKKDNRNKKARECLSVFGYGKAKNEAGFKQLGRRIKNFLYHGPEIDSLSKITFIYMDNNKGMSVGGEYFPKKREIEINVKPFFYLDNDPKNIMDKEKLTAKREINSLMGTIVHEYGHHIMQSYARIHKSGGKVGWNTKFYNSFKKALHYDKSNYKRYPGEFGKSDYLESLGNGLSAKELFDIANNNANHGIEKYAPFVNGLYDRKGIKINGYKHLKSNFQIKGASSDIKYYYSLKELATNQMSMLMYHSPFRVNVESDAYNMPIIKRDSLYDGKTLNVLLPLIMRNYIIIATPKGPRIYKDLLLHKKLLYMEDSAWGGSQVIVDKAGNVSFKEQVSTAEVLYKTYEQIMGFITSEYNINGSAINNIYYGSGRTEQGNLKKTLKISGFIPSKYAYDHLKGIVLNGKKYSFKIIKSFLTHKDGMLGNSTKRTKDSYVTIENIDLSKLGKKTQIFWWKDNDNDGILDEYEQLAMKAENISQYQNLNTHINEQTYSEITTKSGKVYLINGLKK